MNGSEDKSHATEGSADTGATANRATSQRQHLLDVLRAAGVTELPEDGYDELLLRTSQVAALLRSSDRTIRAWADAGKLRYIKTLGGRRLFPVSGVMQVMQIMNEHSEEA